MKNDEALEKQADPDPPWVPATTAVAPWMRWHWEQFGSQSNSPDLPSGNTKQIRHPLKKKEKDITRSSRKEKMNKRKKKWRRLKTSSAVTAVLGFKFCLNIVQSNSQTFRRTYSICWATTTTPGLSHFCCTLRPLTSSHKLKWINESKLFRSVSWSKHFWQKNTNTSCNTLEWVNRILVKIKTFVP